MGGRAVNGEDTRQQAEGYNVYGRQIAGSVLGTNQGMIYNGFSLKDLVQLFNDIGITFTLQKENPPAEAMASFVDARKRQVAEMVRNGLWDAALANESIRDEPADRTDVAAMPSTIDEWYYQLDAYERCYVIAATMLQGAPVDVVSQKAKELCQSNHTSLQELQTASSSLVGDGILGRSASKFKRRTYTTTRQIGGTSRLQLKVALSPMQEARCMISSMKRSSSISPPVGVNSRRLVLRLVRFLSQRFSGIETASRYAISRNRQKLLKRGSVQMLL
jgi:hypothetical protein